MCFEQGCSSLTYGEPEVTVFKHEFVPLLVNFLREQSSQALAHGPATPAKTPSRPRPPAQTQGFTDRRTCRPVGGGAGTRSTSRVQLFSPASSVSPGADLDASGQSGSLSGVNAFNSPPLATTWSPASRSATSERRSGQRISLGDYMVSPPDLLPSPSFQAQRGRRRGAANVPTGGPGRQGGGRGGHHSDENGRWESGGRRSGRGSGGYSRISEQVSPPSVGQLNLSNLEDFPPVGSTPISPA